MTIRDDTAIHRENKPAIITTRRRLLGTGTGLPPGLPPVPRLPAPPFWRGPM